MTVRTSGMTNSRTIPTAQIEMNIRPVFALRRS